MNQEIKHPLLASPAFIGNLELKNRMIMAAMGSNFASEDGHASEQLAAYYEERARGGVGLIILETSAITWPAGASMPNMIGFSKDEFIPTLQSLTQRVHQAWSKNSCSTQSQWQNCSRGCDCRQAYSSAFNSKITTKRHVWSINSR